MADALDGTVTRLAAPDGRPAGPALPAGPTPWQLAPGPDGSLLVLSASAERVGELTLLGGTGGRWAPRRVPVGARTRQALLAGDGGDVAVVAYTARGGAGPRAAGGVRAGCGRRPGRPGRAHARGVRARRGGGDGPGGRERARGDDGLPRRRAPAPIGRGGGASRVVALDAASGARLAVRPLAGPAGAVVLARAPDGGAPRLYSVELAVGADPEAPAGDHARLLGLDPATLEVERAYPLGFRPRALAVAPDGERAYALAGAGNRLMEIDLLGGAQRHLADVPGAAQGLAVAGPRLYVPDPYGGAVLVFDRRTGDPVARVRVGRRPAVVLAVIGDRLSAPDTSGGRPWAATDGGPLLGGLAAMGAVTAALRRPAQRGKGGSCAAPAPSSPR